MTQAMDKPINQDMPTLEKRVEVLESVLRTVLEQINTHQVYDRDARGLIKRTLGPATITGASPASPAGRRGEFPSLFPSATPSNFI